MLYFTDCKRVSLVLAGIVLGLLVHSGTFAQHTRSRLTEAMTCSSDAQIVMCGQVPLQQIEEHRACCRAYRPVAPSPSAAAAIQATAAASEAMQASYTAAHRPDLDSSAAGTSVLSNVAETCPEETLTTTVVDIPTFQGSVVQYVQRTVPYLKSEVIQSVKRAALMSKADMFTWRFAGMQKVDESSGFIHPGTVAGPAELALMQQRLAQNTQPQEIAKEVLLSGSGVQPKLYPSGWHPPTNTPLNYPGPFATPTIDIKWSGINSRKAKCPENYPKGPPEAPEYLCGHISLVELDGQMAYKQALAYLATGDKQYAENVFRVLDGWAEVNKEFGQLDQNGPLEAGWACASMSRALELLKDIAPPNLIAKYTNWINEVLMPQMDFFTDVVTPIAVNNSIPHVHNNWHTTLAECYMSFGILTDDRPRYNKGIALYHTTLKEFLKWGRGQYANNRYIGECSETLRDIYHSQFGFAGLLQAAEIAWQQHEDLYSSNNYALVAAMELHARIIRAYQLNNPGMLPAGFKLKEDMPEPPPGCMWKFEMRKQLWQAVDMTTYKVVGELRDGHKYLVGIWFLPSGWEVGYNHFAGRLGLHLPETAALLASNWPEWYDFHWGLGTLTHANTAKDLWTAGLSHETLCKG